jgi:hypothetical protein
MRADVWKSWPVERFADVFKFRCKTDDMLYDVKRHCRQLYHIRERERTLRKSYHFFLCQPELYCRDNCQPLMHSLLHSRNLERMDAPDRYYHRNTADKIQPTFSHTT